MGYKFKEIPILIEINESFIGIRIYHSVSYNNL